MLVATVVLVTSFAGTSHRVRPGDTLSHIAARYGTSVSAIVKANAIRNPNHIVVGSTIDVPGGSGGVTTPTTTSSTYLVRPGDTLSGIASKHGVSVAAIVSANRISNPNLIIAGRSLTIPGGGAAPQGASGTPAPAPGGKSLPGQRHRVSSGESLAGIAARYGIATADLARWNGITDGRIYATTSLLLFDPGSLPSLTGGSAPGSHTVASGETLGSIARRYATSVAKVAGANAISNPNLIRVGQRLTIPGGSGASIRCPIPGATFFNDWAFPRSGGRWHAGNDLFASRGTPVYAPVSGALSQTSGSISGLAVRLTDNTGGYWFFGHLDSFGAKGQVKAGDVIGYVGDSGNARGSRPHAHVEYKHVNGSSINPYPVLRAVC